MNRARTLARLRQRRSWRFTYCIRLCDLCALVRGHGYHAKIPAELRRRCLQHLLHLLEEHEPQLRLVVVDDGDAAPLARQLRAFESLYASGGSLAVWRDHGGNLYWTEHPPLVRAKRRLLEAFERAATYREPHSVRALLRDLLERGVPRECPELRQLSSLGDAISRADELPPEQRSGTLALLEEIRRQASLPEGRRSPDAIKAALCRLTSLLSGAPDFLPLWVKAAAAILALLGIDAGQG